MSSPGVMQPEPRAGTNLKDAAAGAAWTYLLDTLELEAVLCLGRPRPASLTTLQRLARHLSIATELSPGLPERRFDLVYVSPTFLPVPQSSESILGLAELLRPHGRIVLEGSRASRLLTDAGIDFDEFWATPARGEVRSAVPVDDDEVRRYFVREGIAVPSMPRPLRLLDRIAPVTASRGRTLVVSHPRAGERSPKTPPARSHVTVPRYLQSIAARDGFDIGRHRLGLSARGRYSSRKVVLYLFAPDEPHPELIVKTTRDPLHNSRLANEAAALRHVESSGLAQQGTFPAVRFAGEHGGLVIVGEEAVDGRLLSRRSDRGDATGAYDWLTDLAASSARRGPAEAEFLRSHLERTVQLVERTYALPDAEARLLRLAATAIVELGERVPLVMMHGDPTSGNAVRRPDGRTAFLDWESATTDGVPLWDVFHFARSHLLDVAPIRRIARTPRNLVATLSADRGLRQAVDRYVERLEIPDGAIGPLLITGWAHRALKEVSRLPADRLERGHYIGVLRASLKARL